ncbi:2'-5' RNA ligase family protein [Nocardioides mesophilus]|uniref:2'-5' RNA ligase family protein n=1 Tax=Nocardioides mesophilus TaxID=433659 RepID=A0A7G9RDQ0_9ACTN|nr:2'-5' RNA ligase family protein [Nocardioides mesophilus]QNN53725.1 2'-5' RNA ligase family protein [Nocardioides mesophilus]
MTSQRTTIGVAIAVPEPWGAQLQEYRERLGDRTASGIPTHITLVPPYHLDTDELVAVEQHLVETSASNLSFKVHLRGTGTFRPVSPVVFVTVAEGIAGCEQLAVSVRRGPLGCDLRFPYHPHVTVAHDLDEPLLDRAYKELAEFECAFEVDHFSLYVHHEDEGWVRTRDFALTAARDR